MGFNSVFKGLIMVVCLRQQWLHERALFLSYTWPIVFYFPVPLRKW